jgi:hypothetical protein
MIFHASGIAAPTGNLGAADFDGRLIAIEAIRVDSAAKWKALVNAAIYAGIKEAVDSKKFAPEVASSRIRGAEGMIARGEQVIAAKGLVGLTAPPTNFFQSLVTFMQINGAPQTATAVQRAAARFWREVEQPLKGETPKAASKKSVDPVAASVTPTIAPPTVAPEAPRIPKLLIGLGIAVPVVIFAGLWWALRDPGLAPAKPKEA